VAAGENDSTATVKICRKRCDDVMEVVHISRILCAVVRSHRYDNRAMRRTKLKPALYVPIQGQEIERETKPNKGRGRVWN
jgi:hypothetical protein